MTSPQNFEAAVKGLHTFFQGISGFEESLLVTSRRVMLHLAEPLVTQIGITDKIAEPVQLLDLACGTGIVTHLAQMRVPKALLEKSRFQAGDTAEGMINMVKKRIEAEGWVNTEASVMNAKDTRLPAATLSHVAVALGLHLIPDPDAVIKDSVRILKPGGVFGASTFARENSQKWWLPDMRSAFAALPFDTPPISLGMQMHDYGHWDDAAWVEPHLRELGLEDVLVKENHGTYHFEGADEYMTAFEGMMTWMINSQWDEETRKAHSIEEIKRLVKEHLREKYAGQGWDVTWTTITMTGKSPRPDSVL